MENLGYIVLIRRSVYMSVLLCVHSQNDVFPSPFFLPYTKVAPSPSLLPLSSWFSNCTQNDVTAQHLSWEPRTKKKYYSVNRHVLQNVSLYGYERSTLETEILETTFSFRNFRAILWCFRVPVMSGNHFVTKRFQKRKYPLFNIFCFQSFLIGYFRVEQKITDILGTRKQK